MSLGIVVELDALNTPCRVLVNHVIWNTVASVHQRRYAPAVVHEVHTQGLVIEDVPFMFALIDDEVHEPHVSEALVEIINGWNIPRA